MRFVAAIAIALVLVLGAGAAGAQVQGQYTGAQILEPGGHLFGGYLDVSRNVVGLMAQLRLSFYPGVDFGFQGGASRLSKDGTDKGTIRLGTDFRVGTHRATPERPYDLAFGGCLDVETGDNYNLFSIGPDVALSHSFNPGKTGGVTVFTGAVVLFTSASFGGNSDNGWSMPLRIGAEFIAAPSLRLTTELQYRAGDDFRDKTVIDIGVNAPF